MISTTWLGSIKQEEYFTQSKIRTAYEFSILRHFEPAKNNLPHNPSQPHIWLY